ncbi:MAG: 6-carboxytetrahydropterin synthase [Pseudomonadales bacterium]
MKKRVFYAATQRFEAARQIESLSAEHPARRLHGHGFRANIRTELADTWAPFAGAETSALASLLNESLEPLDYQLLNECVPCPTDENLAYWLKTKLAQLPGLDTVGIQSTENQGATLTADGDCHVWRTFRFEAAHQLPNVPPGHQCGRMHGHGFDVTIHVRTIGGETNGQELAYDALDAVWKPLQSELHLSCLNDIPGLDNPTSELLAVWLWQRIQPRLPQLSWITVNETSTAGCHYDGHQCRIWKQFQFESAMRLTRAPELDARRRLHGHSYTARLHLTAPLDEVLGWVQDYGDVKEIFAPTLEQLDHHFLNDTPGLNDADISSLLGWIHSMSAPGLPQLDRIDLFESQGCGGLLTWGGQRPALPS